MTDDDTEDTNSSTTVIPSEQGLAYDSHLKRMMTSNFMEFASYVIKDRAIPDIDDGLKPVQRRILHTLKKVDDGKYHKVANIVGEAMKYHPHGDSSIYGALVNIANKDFFIDKQGNFGNIITGDNASAARYIECRLTPLARETLFNKEITTFVDSYDGRNQEPVVLPAKVPVLLMQGAEGIAVGMATKVLPHNFNELLKAQIDILKDKRIKLYPDFPHGGLMDVSQYDNGLGKVKVRAKIEKINKNTLVIKEIAAGTTTENLIQSIEDAVKNGKLKLTSINDFTGENVEIELKVSRGVDADRMREALFAFTNCEVSLSSNITVIKENRPVVASVPEVLYHNTQKLVDCLRWELEIEHNKLNERFHEKTLEQLFIEKRIYKRIEECTEENSVYAEVFSGLEPFKEHLRRDVVREDIDRLLRIPIRRISLFDINKNRKELDDILREIEQVKYNLQHLKQFTINFIRQLLDKYGKDYPRRTEIKELEEVDAKEIALENTKIGLDRQGGYIGTSVSGADSFKCTEFDKIVVLFRDGKFKVMNIPDKLFVGRFFEAFPVDKEQVYSIIYKDTKSGFSYHKRCKIDRFILDKEYHLCPPKCKIEIFETNYNVVLECQLEDTTKSKDQTEKLIFEDIPIRATAAKGFKTAKRKIVKFTKIKRGNDKNPQDDNEPQEDDSDNNNTQKKEWGWKSTTPINFTAPKPDDLSPPPVKEATELKNPIYSPQSEEKAPEQVDKKAMAASNESQTKKETDNSTPVSTEKQNNNTFEHTKKPAVNATEEKQPPIKTPDNTPLPNQAEFNLPQETGQRRYLIDEDNPFRLEP